ncbi:hypothetical protein B566_EDAN003921, partial [Ephemera danica]
MSDESFVKNFRTSNDNDSNVLRDYTDGTVYKEKYKTENDHCLDLILYSDEFEVANPIGYSRVKHKILAFYLSIGNIVAKFRSRVENIHLVLLCKSAYVKKFGLNTVIAKLVSQIQDLKENASQNRTFLRLLPFILKNCIGNHEDPVWQNILILRRVAEFACANYITLDQLPVFDALSIQYVVNRQILFPSVPLRPKHHYLIHYSDLTMKLGPLIRLWTMRFESKHGFFKWLVAKLKNFINITKSLSVRHQL